MRTVRHVTVRVHADTAAAQNLALQQNLASSVEVLEFVALEPLVGIVRTMMIARLAISSRENVEL